MAGQDGWGDPAALALMAAGLAALGGFAAWERRLASRSGQPLIHPELFSSASFTWGAVLGGVAGLGMIGLLFVMPQYFQAIQGASALSSGLRLLPLVGGLIIGALPASALARAAGAKLTIALGFVLLGTGAIIGTGTGPASSTLFVATWMLVLCAGTGMALTAATAVALVRLPAERSGIGCAVVQAFQKTAGPFGSAITGSVLAAAYRTRLNLGGLPAAAAAAARQGVYGGVTAASQYRSAALASAVRTAFTGGIDVSLWVSAGIAAVGAALTMAFLPGRAAVDRSGPRVREGTHASRH
jgi:Na+/melibiose symporter-like transporter